MARPGGARQGVARQGGARQGRDKARDVPESYGRRINRGRARLGGARHGWAWQGEARLAVNYVGEGNLA